MQYAAIFKAVKIVFLVEKLIYFLQFAHNRDRGYTLELPNQGGLNEYPQSMF